VRRMLLPNDPIQAARSLASRAPRSQYNCKDNETHPIRRMRH
jgi:hypothetical protein